jgi:ATP-dependent helicase HrpB
LLPITSILPQLQNQLLVGDAIVVAPPGAGKSTHLPLTLLSGGLFANKKIIMLQPRRIAVRNIAAYLAAQLNESVGQTIGYRIRGESKVSATTKLEIVTEGILTRMLQHEPELPSIGLIIFDEFHERSVHADFSLALCLEVQQSLRQDLRLLVMSATMDVDALRPLLPSAMLLESAGRSFPVDVHYHPNVSKISLADKVTQLILSVFPQHKKDALVFLPGVADIKRVAERLTTSLTGQVEVHSLYGELTSQQQQGALMPSSSGCRKIVLATNIAETSLTIEGIELVIDSGIEKCAIFHLTRGINQLRSQKISQASATQRAGRAGRLGPGTCYRLWSQEQQQRLSAQSSAEILYTDMASFVLEAAVWGSAVNKLNLLDFPSAPQLEQAQQLLLSLGLLDNQLKVTDKGRKAHRLGCHPSIANMLLKTAEMGQAHLSLACAIATLLEHRDPLGIGAGAQLSLRLSYLLASKNHGLWQYVRQWYKKVNCGHAVWPLHDVASLLAFAFPQRLAKVRQQGRYLLAGGSGVKLPPEDGMLGSDWLVVADMLITDQQQDDALIRYAEPIDKKCILAIYAESIEPKDVLVWDKSAEKISASRELRLGSIVLQKDQLAKPSTAQIQTILRAVIVDKGIESLRLNDECLSLQHRATLAQKLLPEENLPDLSNEGLLNALDSWFLPFVEQMTSWAQILKLDFYTLLKNQFSWHQWQSIEQLLPSQLLLPSGRRHTLSYGHNDEVTLAVRMQELYGLQVHPSIARGKRPLTIALLSPARRPLQTTQDLPGFWQGTYKQVQKEMKGRYPRHFWPDDPANSPATTTTKKNMKLS